MMNRQTTVLLPALMPPSVFFWILFLLRKLARAVGADPESLMSSTRRRLSFYKVKCFRGSVYSIITHNYAEEVHRENKQTASSLNKIECTDMDILQYICHLCCMCCKIQSRVYAYFGSSYWVLMEMS